MALHRIDGLVLIPRAGSQKTRKSWMKMGKLIEGGNYGRRARRARLLSGRAVLIREGYSEKGVWGRSGLLRRVLRGLMILRGFSLGGKDKSEGIVRGDSYGRELKV
jgi:hypothetical protein